MKRISSYKNIFLFLILFFSFINVAQSSDETFVQQRYQNWCQAMGTARGDAKQIVRFYAPHAILLPTLSSKILINDNHGLDDYFAKLTAHNQFKCTPQKIITQLFGSIAINSGTYTFSYRDDKHQLKKVPARFTFVYQKQNDKWMIVNHHSSKLN